MRTKSNWWPSPPTGILDRKKIQKRTERQRLRMIRTSTNLQSYVCIEEAYTIVGTGTIALDHLKYVCKPAPFLIYGFQSRPENIR